MKILAIETSTNICSIAYIINGKCDFIVEDMIPRQHAEKLPIFYNQLVQQSNFNLVDIDSIAVSIGPGSFAGLRIGLSYAKGLAYSHAKPIIPVPTLESLLYGSNTDFDNAIVIVLSHRNKYYIQRFRKLENEIHKDKIQPVELNNINELSDISSDTMIVHYNCEKLFEDNILTIKTIIPSARLIGELSYKNYDNWIEMDPFKLVPQYISPFKIG